MLQPHQTEHIASVPKDKITRILPFDPATQAVARDIAERTKAAVPGGEVFHIGSSKFGIAGENDIDMTVVAGDKFTEAYNFFEEWYGKPVKTALHDNYAMWEWKENGFPVELHLIDVKKPYFEEQLKTQAILEGNEALRAEYEQMKLVCDGLPYTEYLKRKYEFWNKIVGL